MRFHCLRLYEFMSLWTCVSFCAPCASALSILCIHCFSLAEHLVSLSLVRCSPKPPLVLHGIASSIVAALLASQWYSIFRHYFLSLFHFSHAPLDSTTRWRRCICCYEWKAFIFLPSTRYTMHTVHPELQTRLTRRKMRFCILPFSLHEQYEAVYGLRPRRVYEVCDHMDQVGVEKVEIYSLLNWIGACVCAECGSVNRCRYCISSAIRKKLVVDMCINRNHSSLVRCRFHSHSFAIERIRRIEIVSLKSLTILNGLLIELFRGMNMRSARPYVHFFHQRDGIASGMPSQFSPQNKFIGKTLHHQIIIIIVVEGFNWRLWYGQPLHAAFVTENILLIHAHGRYTHKRDSTWLLDDL